MEVEKLDHSYIAAGNVKWYCHCGKIAWWFFIKLNIYLPYNPAIALFDIYLGNVQTCVHIKTCTQMLIAPLFVIAQN